MTTEASKSKLDADIDQLLADDMDFLDGIDTSKLSTNSPDIDNGLDDLGLDDILDFSPTISASETNDTSTDTLLLDPLQQQLSETSTTGVKEDLLIDLASPEAASTSTPLDNQPDLLNLSATEPMVEVDFYAQLTREVTTRSDPETNTRIRNICASNGPIPPDLRLLVWSRLLKVERIKEAHPWAQDSDAKVSNQEELRAEVEHLCEQFITLFAFDAQIVASFKTLIERLLTYFCKYRSLETYPTGCCNAVAPLFVAYLSQDPASFGSPETFHLLYALMQNAFPHFAMGICSTRVAAVLQTHLRSLLMYHDAKLGLFLDHQMPNWIELLFAEEDAGAENQLETLLTAWPISMVSSAVDYLRLFDSCLLLNPVPSIYPLFMVLSMVFNMKNDFEQFIQDGHTTGFGTKIKHYLESEANVTAIATTATKLLRLTPLSIQQVLADAGITQTRNDGADSAEIAFFEEMLSPQATAKSSTSVSLEHYAPAVYFSLTILPSELVPSLLTGRKRQVRDPVQYFVIDCRAPEYIKYGRLPTAFHFDPIAFTETSLLENLMETLTPLRNQVHICVMGQGDGALALVSEMEAPNEKLVEDLLNEIADDSAHVNDLVLFLIKQQFPFVSVLEGGYSGVHRYLSHSSTFNLTDLVDHSPSECYFCSFNKNASSKASVEYQAAAKYLTGAFKGGKSWLKKKKLQAEDKLHERNFSEQFKEGKNWLARKKGDIEIPDMKIPLPRRSSTAGPVDHESLSSNTSAQASAIATSLGNSLNSFGMKIRQSTLSSSTAEPPSERKSVPTDSSRKSSLESAKRFTSRFSLSSARKGGHNSASKTKKGEPPIPAHTEAALSEEKVAEEAEDEVLFTIGDEDDDEDSDAEVEMDDILLQDRLVDVVNEDQLATIEPGAIVKLDDLNQLEFVTGIFFCHKRKYRGTKGEANSGSKQDHRMLPRNLCVLGDYILVFKAYPNDEQYGIIKSCNHISTLAKMTCFKKNTLMISLYYEPKTPDAPLKVNTYQLQQRDAFIQTLKTRMETYKKMHESQDES